MELRNQQELLFKSLLEGGDSQEMIQCICQRKGVDSVKRLEVYQKSYRARIIKRLKEDYYVFTQIMGDERAWDIFSDYLDKNPPRNSSLAEIGRAFPRYIWENKSEYKDFMLDLVHFEWSLHSSFYREYDPFKEVEEYPKVLLDENSNTVVQLHSSVQVSWSAWPIVKIYQDERELPPSDTGALIWSLEGQVAFKSIDRFAFHVIEGLQKRMDIYDIVSVIDEPGKNLPDLLQSVIADLASRKLIQSHLHPSKSRTSKSYPHLSTVIG